ncbi:MAG: hypothetical protein P4L93_01095 [Coriobacteriia bacterium]|nr:hypothetical protein [Coriobacteriia bacterium]
MFDEALQLASSATMRGQILRTQLVMLIPWLVSQGFEIALGLISVFRSDAVLGWVMARRSSVAVPADRAL